MFLLNRVRNDEDSGALGQMLTEPELACHSRKPELPAWKLEESFSLDEPQTTWARHQ